MSLETAKDLSVSDLLRLLGEKLDVECTKLRENPLSPSLPAISEVSELISSTRESSN